PQPKHTEKQAQQVQALARQERRRSDAAATVVEKDTQNAPEQPANSEAPAMTSVSAPQPWPDNPYAAAPMKQQAQGKAATNATGSRDGLGGGDRDNVPRAIAHDRTTPPRAVAGLGVAKVTRAIYSERQLQQVMHEFWLNENYGRDLMELHTLGVDGGYTQKDVTEVARCFTGWTIDKPRQYADFKFDDRLHDPDTKIVLRKKIHAGGMKDGEQVIDMLAH